MDMEEQRRRLALVRAELERNGLTAFLVPRADEHQGEYVPPSAERLAWISGFDGSAGLAVVTRDGAALFVDGRYVLQARSQSDPSIWEHRHLIDEPLDVWAAKTFSQGDRIGFDPWLHTPEGVSGLRKALERIGATLTPTCNLIDAVWSDRPAPPKALISLYPESLAGENSASKRARIAADLKKQRLEAMVVSAPDSLAWLFNIRGGDLSHAPFALGFAVVRADKSAALFVDAAKLSGNVRHALTSDSATTLSPPEAFGAALDALSGQRVRVDRATGGVWLVERLKAAGAEPDVGDDLCALPKACKNASELAGIRAAHFRDAVAMARFLAWLSGVEPGTETEWSLAAKLETLRAEGDLYRSLSFDSISAVGPNAAIPHYRVNKETALTLVDGSVYLIDSGAQYLDGTTDVTRTTIMGTPTSEMRRRYTQVLKGHVALAASCFPEGTAGSQLDVLARRFLWADGVDYDHGTGHGVGCYLSVHEGPQRIAKTASAVALRPGMVVSNEPGYYKAGAFGMRIENLLAVTPLNPGPRGAERSMLGFETLTLCPYETRLIDPALLTETEIAWIDAYHARVHSALAPLVDAKTAVYLASATKKLMHAS